MNAVKDDNVHDLKKLQEDYPEVCAKYPLFINDYVNDSLLDPTFPVHPLRQWQQDLNACLKCLADTRTIEFIIDHVGNAGKSWFAKYYCSLHSDAFILRPMKHADMAYGMHAMPIKCRVLFLDCTSKRVEYMPYIFMMEEYKEI